MTEYPDLGEVARRPIKYWSIDGLPELTMGGLWVIWGGAFLLGNALPKGPGANAYWTIVPFILVASSLMANRATRRLKERITFPRTGYVAMQEPRMAARILTAAIAALGAAGLTALIAASRTLEWENVVTSGTAVVIALALAAGSLRTHAPHLLWLSAFSLLLGLVMYLVHAGYPGLNWMLVALGSASVVLGSIRLRRFLERHPRSTETAV